MNEDWSEKIGETAGKVWETLNVKGGATFATLKKSLRETDGTVYEAIGWLAREGKIEVRTRGKNRIFTLNGL